MKILFFSPHSAIWIHAFPEALVAEAAMQEGNEIIYVGCGGLLSSHCVSMSGCGVAFESPNTAKASVCRLCKRNEQIIRKHFGFPGIDLVEVINSDDLTYAEEVAASVTPANCRDLVVEEIEVGRIALYELLIQSKKSEFVFSDTEWQRYKANLKNVLMVLRVAGRILTHVKPDRVVLYNALYSVNRVVCRLCDLQRIPQYFLHAGENLSNRLSTIVLAREHAFSYYGYLRAKWIEMQHHPSDARCLRLATDHFLEVMRGRSLWAYSTAPQRGVDLKRMFKIEVGRKVISATMSSEDERCGAEMIGAIRSDLKALFPTQIDWIRGLIDYVENRNDLILIIRVHPREFPNKRESVLSGHAKALGKIFADLPANVRINWPTDNVSLYDLVKITDVFANAWSSAGKEMAWLGLPVVLYSRDLTLYPPDLNYVGTTEEEYFGMIERALWDGWNAERIRKTYRWCAMEYVLSSLDISESFSRSEARPLLVRGFSKLMRTAIPYRRQELDCTNRSRSLSCSDTIGRILAERRWSVLDMSAPPFDVSEADEKVSLKREVQRLVNGLYGSRSTSRTDTLARNLIDYCGASS